METEFSFANIISEHIVTPIKKKFDSLLKANAQQDEIINTLKELCQQHQNQIAELDQRLSQAYEIIQRQSEELKKHFDLIQMQSGELTDVNEKVDMNHRRQSELEEAISNIDWEG